jgi:hypothetical protein
MVDILAWLLSSIHAEVEMPEVAVPELFALFPFVNTSECYRKIMCLSKVTIDIKGK